MDVSVCLFICFVFVKVLRIDLPYVYSHKSDNFITNVKVYFFNEFLENIGSRHVKRAGNENRFL